MENLLPFSFLACALSSFVLVWCSRWYADKKFRTRCTPP